MNRLVIVARNDYFPTLQLCPDCGGCGHDHRGITCSTCEGEGQLLLHDPRPLSGSTPGTEAAEPSIQTAHGRRASLPQSTAEPSNRADWQREVSDGLAVITGLMVFSVIALFFAILA